MRQNMNEEKRKNMTVKIMAGVITLLVIFILFFFVFQPQLAKYNDEKRLEGIQFYVTSGILPQIQQNGYMQLPIGNQTLILAAVTPEELQFLSQVRQQAQAPAAQ